MVLCTPEMSQGRQCSARLRTGLIFFGGNASAPRMLGARVLWGIAEGLDDGRQPQLS